MPNLVLELVARMEEDDGRAVVMVGSYKTRVAFQTGSRESVCSALLVGMRQLTSRTAEAMAVDISKNVTVTDMLERLEGMKAVGIKAVEKIEPPVLPSVEDKGDEVSFR